MPYRLLGRAHATLFSACSTLRRECGQGTVEYVALILLLAGVFAAVVLGVGGRDEFQIGDTIVKKVKDSIDGVGDPPGADKK